MKLEDVILRDTRASQPAATAVAIGTLYYVTDESVTERSNGTTWDDYSDLGAAAPVDAEYVVGATNGTLSAERVGTDTAEIDWDFGTAGQAKLNLIDNSVVAARSAFTTTQRLLGRNTAGAGAGEEVTWEQARAWATQKIWVPDYPPASAGALDDEFADASGGLPAGWTEYDHGTLQTPVEQVYGLELQHAGSGSNQLAGVYKADPTGDITVVTKVSLSGAFASGPQAGIGWLQDGATSTADAHWIRVIEGSANLVLATSIWTAYNTFSSNPVLATNSAGLFRTHAYLRLRRTGTTYAFDYSSDGVGWIQLSSGAISFTPTHIALLVLGTGAVRPKFAFFRSTNSDVGVGGVLGGARV